MLSAIGRASIRRVVATRPKSTNQSLQSITGFERVDGPQSAHKLACQFLAPFSSSSSYHAAGANETKSTTTAKPKAAPRKKATTVGKPKPKKKTVAKKSKPKKKVVKKVKPRVKKPLSPEKVLKLKTNELKGLALELPKKLPDRPMQLFMAGCPRKAPGVVTTTYFLSLIAAFKALSPLELETLNHKVSENKAANRTAYVKWVATHTPAQIRTANNARRMLRSKYDSKKSWPKIEDPRAPKGPTNYWARFTADRYSSGDLKGISLKDGVELIKADWEALSPSEKKKYEDAAAADKERWAQEQKTVFGV